MDRVQSRILEIARQIPEYVGYQAKERRREEDKLIRRQLALRYDDSRTRLARIARLAPLDEIVPIENLDQKLQRLIARLNTAPPGYAGWFDAGQIVESDLERLTDYDSSLAGGVEQLNVAFQHLSEAIKSRSGINDAVDTCAELIDRLNGKFDQRDQFLAMGVRATLPAASISPRSPLEALKPSTKATPEILSLTNLKKGDAVSYQGDDLLISGTITYSTATGPFWAYMLEDRGTVRWLRVGPHSRASLCVIVPLAIASPFPPRLSYDGAEFGLDISGTAAVSVEGPSARQSGSVAYARYLSVQKTDELWVEDFDGEQRASKGPVVDPSELQVYRK